VAVDSLAWAATSLMFMGNVSMHAGGWHLVKLCTSR